MRFKILLIAFAMLIHAGTALAQVSVSISGGEKVADTGIASIGAPQVEVKLPFDTEYAINLNNEDSKRRALVHIRVDGRKVTGNGLVLRTGERVSLERFIDNGDLKRGNKFKFVEFDDELKKTRKANSEDGMVYVTVQYEKNKDSVVKYSEPFTGTATFTLPVTPGGWSSSVIPLGSSLSNLSGTVITSSVPTSGVTVEGAESRQRFETTQMGDLDDRVDTLTIKLLGYHKTPPLLMRGVPK